MSSTTSSLGFSLRKWNCERKEGKGENAGPEVGGLRDEPKERLRGRLLKFYPGETFPSPEPTLFVFRPRYTITSPDFQCFYGKRFFFTDSADSAELFEG